MDIPGYLDELQARVYLHTCLFQHTIGVSGCVGEIGCLAGRSFLSSFLTCSQAEAGLAVDCWDSHQFNYDIPPGTTWPAKTFRRDFEANVASRVPDRELRVIQGDSTTLDPLAMTEAVGHRRFRFFHVDGSHQEWSAATDLRNAAAVLAPGGVLVADDVFAHLWPGVSVALSQMVASCHEQSPLRLLPFAIVGDAVMLCRRTHHKTYSDFISKLVDGDEATARRLRPCSYLGADALALQWW